MVKSELIRSLCSENPMLTPGEIEMIVSTFFDRITEHLAIGGRVELRGFGVFSARLRQAHTGRNPLTGATVAVNAKYAPHFKPSKDMNRQLTVNIADLQEGATSRNEISQLCVLDSEHEG